MRNLSITVLLASGLVACGGDRSDPDAATAGADQEHDHSAGGHAHGQAAAAPVAGARRAGSPLFDTPSVDPEKWRVFGAGVHQGEAAPVADVLADPARFEGRPVRIEGRIASVCQESGSWVRIGTDAATVFVRFKDYAFFVPKDARGDAIVEGFVKLEEISVDLQKHLLEDEGKPEEAARVTEPKISVNFEAHGVAITKAD